MDAPLQLPLSARRRNACERGAALLWSVVAIVVVAMLGVAAFYLSSQDRLIGENFESGYRALYSADEGLSTFYATFAPGTDLVLPVSLDNEYWEADAEADEEEVVDPPEENLDEYDGVDLLSRDFAIGSTTLWVTPVKAMEDVGGDTYALEAVAVMEETRNRPAASRALRTFARLLAPVQPLAALMAPGGIDAKGSSDHLHVEGLRRSKCGSGTGVAALMAPKGSATLESHSLHLKPDNTWGVVDTSSTSSYTDMMAQMDVNWARLMDLKTYQGLQHVFIIPSATYPTLNSIPFGNYNKKEDFWPIVIDTSAAGLTINVDSKGFGMLITKSSLKLTNKKLDWTGVIMVGKALSLSSGSVHLHAKGVIAAGLGCNAAQAAAGDCKVEFQDKHLGLKYEQCNVEAAWAQLMILRPLTPSRHTVMY